MAYAMKNSLFVRNLSPEVSEDTLREIFGQCDEIEQITFKPYNTLSNQFFAQVDFRSSKGITEGSRLSGTAILGVPCVTGVIDPLVSPTAGLSEGELSLNMDAAAIQAEFDRRTKEAEEDQKFRTVHITGVGMDMTQEAIRTLCNNFGPVERLRIDEDDQGQRFALCEFRERGPAHVCKMQQQYLVQGRLLQFMEAHTMVDECSFAERTVQFEDTYLHAIAMRSQLTQPGQMAEKLKLVRQAAEALLPSATANHTWGYSRDPPTEEQLKKKEKKKKKKEKKEKKEGEEGAEKKDKKEKKEKKRRKKEQELQRQSGGKAEAGEERGPGRPGAEGEREAEGGLERSGSGSLRQSRVSEVTADGRKIVRYKRKRRPGEKKGEHKGRRRGEASRSRSAKKAELVDDESDGPIDLDEVEVVQGTELVVMGGPSSSSSSSSSDDAQAVRGRKGPIELDLDGVVSLDAEAQVPARAKAPAEDARSEASGESMC